MPSSTEMSRQTCNYCGLQLTAPPGARTVCCPGCYSIIVCSNGNGDAYSAGQYNGYTNTSYPLTNYSHSAYQQQWPSPQFSISPPSVNGPKRALLIGINYYGQQRRLKGSVDDARHMYWFLVNRMGFPNQSILFLTDEEIYDYRQPTLKNIQMAMRWLVQGCQSGDSLVFYFSGHASQLADQDGDEHDGIDEALCPVDHETQGKIADDEINATIVRPLPYGAKLHAIIDTCFSGTFLDLPFMCRMNSQGLYTWEDHRVWHAYKGTYGGTALCFSACDDRQNSGDTTAITGYPTSAMTYSFIQTLENQTQLTYGNLLQSIRFKICDIQSRLSIPYVPIQVPQLSSTEIFDIHSRVFMI